MRIVAVFVLSLLSLSPSKADDAAQLMGAWKLVSFTSQIVGDNEPAKDVWGPNPKGFLLILPEGRTMALLMANNRKPATNDAEAAALLKSMNAYSGRYTIEGDKWITVVDAHHNEIYLNQPPQVRYFKVDGDKLTVKIPEQPSAIFIGKKITATLEWVRDK